uniref:Autophagy-related protein 2 n=1 Tax=Kwoniella dejecticola CBS 10117 TaxID=1296121 RepID=A0A1A6A8A4_9TREE|nr:uncharacterized protein I303_04005 [Kwoniella dejecticola CBS 10117]OBR86283.1 hypothetical protein I303_04005 [Kwoniella dejecticola CBS 10117]
MFSLPAFLTTFPFTLPSLPSISLPASIQRRFLSYVLKRSLGRFVRSDALDAERIQAQLSEGWVELEGLEVDSEEINSLIPASIPLYLSSGTLSKVTARVPLSNLWSDPLCLTLDTLSLTFVLSQPTAPNKGKQPSRGTEQDHHRDLAESVTSAADDFLHEELDAYEEAELDRSIRQSLVLNATDPFNNDEVPGSFPFGGPAHQGSHGQPLPVTVESTTVLAGLVERILSRLESRIKNIKIQIRFEDEAHGGVFEIRIGEIKYADESQSSESTGQDIGSKTIRSIRLSGVSVHMLPYSKKKSLPSQSIRPSFASASSRSSSISSTSSSSAGGEYQDMMMSQAVFDLRQSTMSAMDSEASVYLSAISERPQNSIPSIPEKAIEDDLSRSATPTPASTPKAHTNDSLILTFGSEDIILRMTNDRGSSTAPAEQSASSASASPPSAQPIPISTPSKVNIDVTTGTIATVILPEQLAIILAALQYACRAGPTRPEAPDRNTSRSPSSQPYLSAHIHMNALFASVIYDISASQDPGFSDTVGPFWARPASTFIPYGHLRIRLDTLQATYSSKGQGTTNQTSQLSATRLPRRKSTITRFTPPSPTLSVGLQDASLFEYLASDSGDDASADTPPGGAFPVLLFDTNLPKQYDVAPGVSSGSFASQPTPSRPAANHHGVSPVFPEFDSVDWRNSGLQRKAGGSEKQWKVKQKGKGILKATNPSEPNDGPVLIMKKDLVASSTAKVSLLPIHAFLDLSLVERLLPMLRSIAPAIRSTPEPLESLEPFGIRSYRRPFQPVRQRTTESIIDDLDAQASSYSTIQAIPVAKPLADVKCPLLRLDIRCPAPVNRRGTWGDGGHLRSGIVTLDMHELRAKVSSASQNIHIKATLDSKGEGTSVEWEKMVLFFSRAPERRSSGFIVIGPLAPDPSELDISPLLPSIALQTSSAPTQSKITRITCRIPSVQAKIEQQTIEGLQFFADDMTHWLDGAFGDGSAPKPRDDLKMIGSRFFGASGSTRGSSSASSSTDDEDEEELSATILKLEISETDVSLHVPLVNGGERVLALKASDMDIKIESNLAGRHESAFNLNLMDAEFSDITDALHPAKIVGRTTPYTLTTQQQPLIQFRFTSLSNAVTQTKETGISVNLSRITFYIKTIDWIKDLARFAKTPEGVFEDVVPSEVTRIKVLLQDCSVHATAPTLGGAVVLVLGVVDVGTDMRSDGDENEITASAGRLSVLAVDDLAGVIEPGVGSVGSGEISEAWRKAGYVHLAEIISVDVHCLRDLTGTEQVLLEIPSIQLKITACADSLASIGGLLGDIAKIAPAKPAPVNSPRRPTSLHQSVNVFDSIDEQAFNLVPEIVSGSEADMIEDDLPTNLDYLDRTSRLASHQPTLDRSTGESLRAWQIGEDGELGSETIKILYNEKFDMDEGYWDSLPIMNKGYDDDLQVGKVRIRVQDCDVKIFLHEGYDWLKTRKAIEDEIRAVRKRLERIRQLLATGQKADGSVDLERATKSVLFNSVYIGLENRQASGEMDNAALIAAIDEELDDLDEEDKESMNSSWQTLPSAPSAGYHNTATSTSTARKNKTKLRGRKLTRSKKPQIEISLSALRAEYDMYDITNSNTNTNTDDSNLSSKLEIKVKEMEILDHIKTSTWKKFLMGMKADSRGNVRETDADMLRFELRGITFDEHQDEEMRLRAKVLPLRLHVDQDALDFLKRFFSFKSPTPQPPTTPSSSSANPSAKSAANDPFFQHVEIFPIELKLDYKPKRVDFAALREGRTIELMNFFHFDGAEMTLRHITLSGITGWDRLGTTLQDLWTPDVKANQLADVISGVSPIRSIVNVGSGVADLILLPIEQYRKDGRLAKGVQRGTNSFVKSTAMEMMKLGARLATGTQIILEKAEGVLGGSGTSEKMIASVSVGGVPTNHTISNADPEGWARTGGPGGGGSSSEDEAENDVVSRYANQPEGMRQGVQAAYKSLSKNVNAAAQTILAVPMEVYERSGDDGPLRAVVRAVPIAVLKPMIGTTEAVSKTLLGMRNSLDPAARRELGDKYK